MYPVNQVILGGDPFNNIDDLDMQIQKMNAYKQRLMNLQSTTPQKLIWDDIDNEISPLNEDQRMKLLQDSEYSEVYNELQSIVQAEILNLVKGRIESTDKGRDLLSKQLRIIKRLKSKIINDTNREMDLFNKFREYSKKNPNITYEEFLKNEL